MTREWKTEKLGDLLGIQNGCSFDSDLFSDTEGLPLIRIRDLKNGKETETRYSGEYEERYVVKSGDFLIGMDGEFGCYEWTGPKALLNQRVCRLQEFSDRVLPRFIFYGVNSHLKAIEDVTAYATVKHLSSKQILAIEFPIPPLPEQKRIVERLDVASTNIARAKLLAQGKLAALDALKKSLLHQAFTGNL